MKNLVQEIIYSHRSKLKLQLFFYPLCLCFLIFGCSKTIYNKIEEELIYKLESSGDIISMPSGSYRSVLKIVNNLNNEDIKITISSNSSDWLSANYKDSVLTVESTDNNGQSTRKGIVTLTGKNLRKDLLINQSPASIDEGNFDVLTVFEDKSLSKIKPDVNSDSVEKIPFLFYKNLAKKILNNTDNIGYRINTYRPYQDPSIKAALTKSSKYSLLDNPTGIYTVANQDLIVFCGPTNGQNISLEILNFNGRSQRVVVKEGSNIIKTSFSGLVYVMNITNEDIPLILKTDQDKQRSQSLSVNIHFHTGEINRVFDIAKSTKEDWEDIKNNFGKFGYIDILGIHTHVIWPINDYIKNNTDIFKMTNYIDDIADQQKEFAGLYKYNKAQNNRMECRVDPNAPAAYATDYYTAYNPSYGNAFTTEEGFRNRMWVLGHEIGHVNQLRPDLRWAGTTEVTNNFFALYNQKKLFGDAIRLTTQSSNDGYTAAFDKILKVKNYWFLPEEPNNHIPKSAIFWQLYLYLVEIEGKEDFFKDYMEHFRVTPSQSTTLGSAYHGALQIEFMRQICKQSKINLLEFFEKWGMLIPTNAVINDYGNKTLIITEEQITNFKNEINSLGYRKPSFDITVLTDLNYKDYK